MIRTIDNCWFKEVCTSKCVPSCSRYNEFRFLLEHSGIPDKYREPKQLFPEEEDLEAFRYLANIKNNIESFVEKGEFLYLWSNHCGNGKSNFCCKIILTYMALIANGNGYNELNGAMFVYVPEMSLLTIDFDNDERESILKKIKEVRLLVLDDIGATNTKDFANSHILNIIDYRHRNGLATIFTSNLDERGLLDKFGARLADRVLSGHIVRLKGASRRGCQ